MKRLASLLLILALLLSVLAGCTGAANGETPASETANGETTGAAHQSIIRLTADSTPILDPVFWF